ncbi:uncharacterized protein LOC118436277 [Folsomia candida]|uniref:uncharacterized protein LOC118436277 n=1 Tax=Folsomia candida TaxID=158441 RepID=UPI001605494B|nr:uncharacterized protein LOC118436277 [Folsomia candida]
MLVINDRWTFFKILPDAIIDSLDDVEDQKSRFSKTGGGTGKKLPKYYGPGAENAAQGGLGVATRPQLKTLKHQQSFTSGNDSKMIAQMAKDHYPLVVSSLALFIVCRSLFYVYFGVGSFVPNFLPLDLSNGVYWLMHSNAAISPLIHFAFDPELREEVGTMIGIRRNPQRTPVVQPEVVLPSIVSPSTTKPKVGTIKNSINNMSKESTFSNWSHFSANNENDNDETRPSVIEVPQPPQCFTTNEKLGEMTSVDVNKNPQILDVHKLSLENANGVVLK